MPSLFDPTGEPADIPAIAGLLYRREYITRSEQAQLVAVIDCEPWDTKWDRRRQSYGAAYGKRAGNEAPAPIPPWGQALGRPHAPRRHQ
jgi:hypothetical protein